jgi:hypothetical protein
MTKRKTAWLQTLLPSYGGSGSGINALLAVLWLVGVFGLICLAAWGLTELTMREWP